MKKRITLIIALAFAVALAICGSTAAFAAEDTNTLYWYFGDESWKYEVLGETKTGKTVIPAETEEFELAYEIDIPESGYYLLTWSNNDFSWLGFPEEIEDGVAYNTGDFKHLSDKGNTELLYRLEKGKTYVGIDHYYSDEETSFEIEFMGSEIKDLTFGENAFNDYLMQADIYYSFEDDYDYYTYENVTVTFNSGITIKAKDCELFYNAKNDELITGKNEITVDFLGFKKNAELTICEAADLVSKIEMTNVEDYYMVVDWYDGYAVPEIGEEEITIYFTDGSKKTVDFDYGYAYVKFPNGRKYEVYASYEVVRSNQVNLVFFAAYEEINSYECGIETTDFIENFMLLNENKVSIINNTTARIRYEYADYIRYSDTAYEFLYNFPIMVESCYEYSSWGLYDLVGNDIGFMYHALTGEQYYW